MIAIVVFAVVMLSGGSPSTAATPVAETTAAATPTGPLTPTPTSAAQQYLAAFGIGDTDTASQLTDDPAASASALSDAWDTLRPTEITTKLSSVSTASVAYTAAWQLASDHVWSY